MTQGDLEAEAKRCLGPEARITETSRTVTASDGKPGDDETKITVYVRKKDFPGTRRTLLKILGRCCNGRS